MASDWPLVLALGFCWNMHKTGKCPLLGMVTTSLANHLHEDLKISIWLLFTIHVCVCVCARICMCLLVCLRLWFDILYLYLYWIQVHLLERKRGARENEKCSKSAEPNHFRYKCIYIPSFEYNLAFIYSQAFKNGSLGTCVIVDIGFFNVSVSRAHPYAYVHIWIHWHWGNTTTTLPFISPKNLKSIPAISDADVEVQYAQTCFVLSFVWIGARCW